jgi:hypothetical protein
MRKLLAKAALLLSALTGPDDVIAVQLLRDIDAAFAGCPADHVCGACKKFDPLDLTCWSRGECRHMGKPDDPCRFKKGKWKG